MGDSYKKDYCKYYRDNNVNLNDTNSSLEDGAKCVNKLWKLAGCKGTVSNTSTLLNNNYDSLVDKVKDEEMCDASNRFNDTGKTWIRNFYRFMNDDEDLDNVEESDTTENGTSLTDVLSTATD